mgnify:FL=1|jgi:chemotaxis protein MotB
MITSKSNKRFKFDVDESSVWISISDLMAGLLIIFILALTFYILNFSEKTHHISKNQILKEQILKNIKKQMELRGFIIHIDENQWVLRLENKTLYDSCAVDMKPLGKKIVTALARTMYSEFRKDEYKDHLETVFIEGHTDTDRIIHHGKNCNFDSNWDLSTKRSINTWNEMTSGEGEPELGNLRNANRIRLFSVSGYGETRPLTESWVKRAINRRIDIRIAMIPPSISHKPKLIKGLESTISKNNKSSDLIKKLEAVGRLREKSKQ